VYHTAYDSFGNPINQSGAGGDRFMFAAREYDSATGLYYDRARYYAAPVGRFTQQDPTGFVGGDTNLYRYVQNEPTIATDPTGTYSVIINSLTLGYPYPWQWIKANVTWTWYPPAGEARPVSVWGGAAPVVPLAPLVGPTWPKPGFLTVVQPKPWGAPVAGGWINGTANFYFFYPWTTIPKGGFGPTYLVKVDFYEDAVVKGVLTIVASATKNIAVPYN
jgi:RHS repeat-associated protein